MKVREEGLVRPGQVVLGYRIERKLGAGSYGQVYLGWQGGRPHALKFIDLEKCAAWASRELHHMVDLRHPNVVRLVGHVLEPKEAPGHLVLIMEYVPGRTLYAWAREENPPARSIAWVLLKLTRALGAVHAAKVLHRDLKGENVLVRDADGEPVVVDFGLSLSTGAPRVTDGALLRGTTVYRSPEAARFFRDANPTSEAAVYEPTRADDLYALGVLFYVLLTDTYPFQGGDVLWVMQNIIHEAPKPPHERNGRVPRELSDLCLKMLDKHAENRFASAAQLAEALEALLGKADASWDVPLCYGWDEAGRTTDALEVDEKDPLGLLRKLLPKHPRRGRRPAPLEERKPSALPRVASTGAVLALGLVGGHLLTLPSRREAEPPPPPSAPAPAGPRLAALIREEFSQGWPMPEACFVWEVAPRWKPPEVPPLNPSQEGVRMSFKQKAPGTRTDDKPPGSRLNKLCVGAAATCLACAGPGASTMAEPPPTSASAVRPQPVPEPCPQDVINLMAYTLRIGIGGLNPGGVIVPGGVKYERKLIPVREGPVQVDIINDWGKLPAHTVFSGRLLLGPERVYGRFTTATLPDGKTYPVCVALTPSSGYEQGLTIRGTDAPDTVRVFPIVYLQSVDRLE